MRLLKWFNCCLTLITILVGGARLGCWEARVWAQTPSQRRPGQTLPTVRTRYPAARRVVAFGDVHGDLQATRTVLKLAGAMDDRDRWIGGDLVVVQVGDQLDRGEGEQAIVDLFESLGEQARRAGGLLVALNGNHEIMNVDGFFRDATAGGFKDFEDVPNLNLADPRLGRFPAHQRARAAAFLPSGPYARKLARHPVVVVVGDVVFVHGGILQEHVTYGLERINRETAAWMLGARVKPAILASTRTSPTWTRRFSSWATRLHCNTLRKVLAATGARAMVVGHSIQKGGINSACDGRVWRIDVGLAAIYGGTPQVLEIRRGAFRVITAAQHKRGAKVKAR